MKNEKENIHAGHRKRLLKELLNADLRNVPPHRILEMLLAFCIPRKDTNPIAHALLKKFGTFSKILSAEIEDLISVDGIGVTVAEDLLFFGKFVDYVNQNNLNTDAKFKSPKDINDYMRNILKNKQTEEFYVLLVGADGSILECKMLASGTESATLVNTRSVIAFASNKKCCGVVLVHNHPNGVAQPSGGDYISTRKIATALTSIEIPIIDHIIIASNSYYSFANNGLISNILTEVKKENINGNSPNIVHSPIPFTKDYDFDITNPFGGETKL